MILTEIKTIKQLCIVKSMESIYSAHLVEVLMLIIHYTKISPHNSNEGRQGGACVGKLKHE